MKNLLPDDCLKLGFGLMRLPRTTGGNAVGPIDIEQTKKMVDDFAKQIDIMETNTVLQYGATAQSKVADFSDTALKNVRTKDIDTVGDTLLDLVSQLRNFEVDDKNDNFFTKIFKKSSNSINDVKAKYDSANSNVDKIVKILENHQITLMKDISL